MAHFINEQCTACDACRPECPTQSIIVASPRYLIDRDTCHDCALCVGVCPVTAIHVIPGSLKPKPKLSEGEAKSEPKAEAKSDSKSEPPKEGAS